MSLSLEDAKKQIDLILAQYASASAGWTGSLLTNTLTSGKVYEAWVLSLVLEKLHTIEDYEITLVGGTYVTLKSSGGPINRRYPHFRLSRSGEQDLEVWTDIQFLTLSYARRAKYGTPGVGPGDHHELDIVAVPAGTSGRPGHDKIVIGVECKNTGFEKYMMRAALGVRRELSLLSPEIPTRFRYWPHPWVPANPPSMLMVYSTDSSVTQYAAAGDVFGVDFLHEGM